MAGTSYNGFSWPERAATIPVQNQYFAEHPDERPTTCCVCGASKGRIDLHLEDYTKPIEGIIPLCYRCHMMVHCRFRAGVSWRGYKRDISAGAIFAPAYTFDEIRRYLSGNQTGPILTWGPQRGDTFLDSLR